jgi:hypothetical protein
MIASQLGGGPLVPGDLPGGLPGFVIGSGHEFVQSVNGVGGYPAGYVFVPEPGTAAILLAGSLLFGACTMGRRKH